MLKEPRPEILSCGFPVQSMSSRLMNLRCISIPYSYPRHVCHKWFFSSISYYFNFKVMLNISRGKYTLRKSHVRLSYRNNIREEINLIIFQQDETYSDYYISVGSSTCFGGWYPSSGVRTTVITASDSTMRADDSRSGSCNYSCTSSWWWVSTPETCRAAYRNIINWIQPHLVGQLLNSIHDERTHEYKILGKIALIMKLAIIKTLHIVFFMFLVPKSSH